jgi:NitT/TauT family transport system permease protein
MRRHAPVLIICLIVLVIWYIACIPMNAVVAETKINAAGGGFAATCARAGITPGL